jgi:hypothetical protein
MSSETLFGLINLAIGALMIRQLFVLGAVLKSWQFLRLGQQHTLTAGRISQPLIFYVVIPVLREASGLRETIKHFETLIESHEAKIIVVTTAREAAESHRYAAADTVALARQLAHSGRFIHLHYPDPQGLKADQLNLAVDYCVACLGDEAMCNKAFLVVYDADSRPPMNSLACFEKSIVGHPGVSVFHQSSRFELRSDSAAPTKAILSKLTRAIADSGALRANRFVLAYELPRLLNRARTERTWINRLGSYVYTHVTGHGLCIRVSLLRELPFPARSPLEDMHYSFLLGSRNVPMVPIPSLDSAEVSDSVAIQFQQLTRWFYGPARFLRYLSDPATQSGRRARILATSAAGGTIEWLGCSIMLPVLAALLWIGNIATHALILVLLTSYMVQLVITEHVLGGGGRNSDRVLRILTYPVTFTLFGVAGIVGAVRLLCGATGAGKTERAKR